MSKTIIVTFTGTESTGKTTAAEFAATTLSIPLIADISRGYINNLNKQYTYDDVLQIAQIVIAEEAIALKQHTGIIISDNCLINIKIWLRYYQWAIPSWLDSAIEERASRQHFLFQPDIDWVADSQRQNPHNREELYRQFVQEMNALNIPYTTISGSETIRKNKVLEIIARLKN